jgi:coniferyl-aldehyde dehydrogenase
MATVVPIARNDIAANLRACFDAQRQAYLAEPTPTIDQRRKDLRQLKALLSDNRKQIISAISQDYGNRSRHESQFAEIISVTDAINDAIRNVRKWSRVQRRHVDLSMFAGGRNRLMPQPLGVVGIIVPWNFPGNLSFVPLAAALAAGNRAMVKFSENSRAFSQLMISLLERYFPREKVAFFEETGGVGIEFSQIPFDLLFFTGSGATGRAVMAAAAKNLTPVVLELGGKSPAVIAPDYPLDKAIERIMFVKQFNAGQICTNVDYVFVHEKQLETFIEGARAWTSTHVPDIHSPDYTSIIDDRSFRRLLETLDDARDKGARVINLNGEQQPDLVSRKMPLHLVLHSNSEMTIRHRETFGPILNVMTYREPQDAVNYINAQDRPLAFYPFSNDRRLVQWYIDRVMSGGVTVNDALYHVAQHDLPFGGVGASGMGHYHGYEGFQTFSKMRPVFYQSGFSAMKFLQPPYGKFATWVYNFPMKFKS